MKEIVLDAAPWGTPGEFLEALKDAVRSPEEQPSDLDAFVDSMIWGDENGVDPPYKLRIINTAAVPDAVAGDIKLLARMVADARVLRRDQEGTDVGVRILLDSEESH